MFCALKFGSNGIDNSASAGLWKMPPLFIISSLYEQWRQNCCAYIDTFLSILNVHQEKNRQCFSSFERAFFLSVLYLQVAIIVRSAMCSAGVSFCGKWSHARSPLMKLEDQLFALCGLSIMVSTSRREPLVCQWEKCQAAQERSKKNVELRSPPCKFSAFKHHFSFCLFLPVCQAQDLLWSKTCLSLLRAWWRAAGLKTPLSVLPWRR